MSIFGMYGKLRAFRKMPLWNKSPYTSQDVTDYLKNRTFSGIGPTYSTIPCAAIVGRYEGGVLAPNGVMYCAPSGNANRVLKINTLTREVSYIESPVISSQFLGYVGGVLAPSTGKIYFCPYNRPHETGILVVNPVDDSVYTIPITGQYATGGGNWSGGTVGLDGKIYFTPVLSTRNFLKLDPDTETMTYFGNLSFNPTGNGASVLHTNGKIYTPLFTTANGGNGGVLEADPATNTVVVFGGTGSGQTKPTTTNQNYRGVVLAPNYQFPDSAPAMYTFGTDRFMKFGPGYALSFYTASSVGAGSTTILSSDGRIYSWGGNNSINPSNDTVNTNTWSGGTNRGRGACLGADGSIYGVPIEGATSIVTLNDPPSFAIPSGVYLSRHQNKY